MSSGDDKARVKEKVVNFFEAPGLRGLATYRFRKFDQLRDLYGKQIKKKVKQLCEEMLSTCYKATIENDDLKLQIVV